MPALIAAGAAAAQSAPFTLADGQTAKLSINLPAGGAIPRDCAATVQYQNSSGAWQDLPERLTPQDPALVLSGAGTYRVDKQATNTVFGIDKD